MNATFFGHTPGSFLVSLAVPGAAVPSRHMARSVRRDDMPRGGRPKGSPSPHTVNAAIGSNPRLYRAVDGLDVPRSRQWQIVRASPDLFRRTGQKIPDGAHD